MARAILFGILGFFAGFATFFVGFMLMEGFSYLFYPVPAEAYKSPEVLHAFVAKYPHWILGVATGIWGLTALLAAWVATRIGGRATGIVLALVLTFMFYTNVLSLPYPFWFKAAEIVSIPICLFIGYQMVAAARVASAAEKKAI